MNQPDSEFPNRRPSLGGFCITWNPAKKNNTADAPRSRSIFRPRDEKALIVRLVYESIEAQRLFDANCPREQFDEAIDRVRLIVKELCS